MQFILFLKKDKFKKSQINEELLKSPNAPSLISREAIEYQNSKLIIYIYPYNHIDHEIEGYSYHLSKDRILLVNGLVNIGDELRKSDIKEFFNKLNDKSELFGDYQLISIDKNGNGSITTPPLSVRQLFYYEDENFTVISTEIKLIVDGVSKFREKTFVNHFDSEFIEYGIFREWKPRNSPEKTIFKEIKRLLPHEIKYFEGGKLKTEKDEIIVPQWFRDAYKENKGKLYDDYYKYLLNFTEINLVNLKPNIVKISLGLTGGFDSRLSASILSIVCKDIISHLNAILQVMMIILI